MSTKHLAQGRIEFVHACGRGGQGNAASVSTTAARGVRARVRRGPLASSACSWHCPAAMALFEEEEELLKSFCAHQARRGRVERLRLPVRSADFEPLQTLRQITLNLLRLVALHAPVTASNCHTRRVQSQQRKRGVCRGIVYSVAQSVVRIL